MPYSRGSYRICAIPSCSKSSGCTIFCTSDEVLISNVCGLHDAEDSTGLALAKIRDRQSLKLFILGSPSSSVSKSFRKKPVNKKI
ncbi:Hypothetical protein FKW44_015571, partial [Caligus rogercresseyi]